MTKSLTDLWTVLIACAEESCAFQLSGSSSIREVKKRWQSQQNHGNGCILKSCSGSKLTDDILIQDVPELAPSSKAVALLAEKIIRVPLALYKNFEVKFVETLLSEKPGDLHPQVRCVLDVPPHRWFRLITVNGPLMYNMSLHSQGVDGGTRLLLDFKYNLTVVDQWNRDEEMVEMFASDDISELFPESGVHRRMLDGRTMICSGDLHDSLTPDLRPLTEITILSFRLGMATLVSGSRVEQCPMWPDDTPSKVFRSLSPLALSGLLFQQSPVSSNLSFLEQKLPEDCILQTFNRILVNFPNTRTEVRMGGSAIVAELQEKIRINMYDSDFFLTFEGRVLDPHEMITPDMSKKGLKLETVNHNIKLRLRDGDFEVSSHAPEIRFSELMVAVARKGGRSFGCLLACVVQCMGCGRRLTKDQEKFQAIPVNCCHIRSLILKETITPTFCDRSIQIGSVSPEVAVSGTANVKAKVDSRKGKSIAAGVSSSQVPSAAPRLASREGELRSPVQPTRAIATPTLSPGFMEKTTADRRSTHQSPERQSITRLLVKNSRKGKSIAAGASSSQVLPAAPRLASREAELRSPVQPTQALATPTTSPRSMEKTTADRRSTHQSLERQPITRNESVKNSRKGKSIAAGASSSQVPSAAPRVTFCEAELRSPVQPTQALATPTTSPPFMEKTTADRRSTHQSLERQPITRNESVKRCLRSFFVINNRNIGEGYMEYYGSSLNKFEVEMNLPEFTTAGEIKTLLAARIGESPASLKLWRWTADIDGEEAYQTMSNEGSGFTTRDGEWTHFAVAENKQRMELEDHHPFPLMPMHKTVVTIFRDDSL